MRAKAWGVAVLALFLALELRPCRAAYQYVGLTPVHPHGGERAILSRQCAQPLLDWQDHVAAYVDVSNRTATSWGQTGWWLGSSPYGVVEKRPVAYWEIRLPDGAYRWESVGAAPHAAPYAVQATGLWLRSRTGSRLFLFRLSGLGGAVPFTEFLHPAAVDWNEGLAEIYTQRTGVEPLPTTRFDSIALFDGSRWRTWTPQVDPAVRSEPPDYALRTVHPWFTWEASRR